MGVDCEICYKWALPVGDVIKWTLPAGVTKWALPVCYVTKLASSLGNPLKRGIMGLRHFTKRASSLCYQISIVCRKCYKSGIISG